MERRVKRSKERLNGSKERSEKSMKVKGGKSSSHIKVFIAEVLTYVKNTQREAH